MTRTYLLAGVSTLLLTLAACGNDASEPATPEVTSPEETTQSGMETETSTAPDPAADPLEAAVDGDWRSEQDRARDVHRHPVQTLEFFEIEPTDTVVEIWPGGGWYTNILAPYLKGEGTYIAAGFDPETSEYAQRGYDNFQANFVEKPGVYGDVIVGSLSKDGLSIPDDMKADAVLTFRNVHNWMGGGYADLAFAEMYDALKPGGILGVVEHRLPSSDNQDPQGMSGYVHEDFVKQLATEAGFEFIESSEINANPDDTADHPFGVWTLPPNSRTADREGNAPEGFDAEKYAEIGESDRMTLKFMKPLETDAAEPAETEE